MRQTMNQNNFQRPYLAILGVAAVVAALGAAFATVLAGSSHAQTGAPNNTALPTISGSVTNGSRLQANRGTWVGTAPITFVHQWLRCNAQGEACGSISGATEDTYTVAGNDVGRTLRVRVTGRNAQGTDTATSNQTSVVQQGNVRSVPVSSVPADERLIVSDVRFSPNPVTSRNQVITATVTIKDTRGLLIRDARVFMRATPRVAQGDLKVTGDDGVATMQLTPNQRMRIQRGFNVQFFIKAFREGDPALAGVTGYRLVQVRTSNV
jgi:Ig domain of plant-specific actin-binding protein